MSIPHRQGTTLKGKPKAVHEFTDEAKCQFLIGKVQRTVINTTMLARNVEVCQFLIGKVQQPFLLAST